MNRSSISAFRMAHLGKILSNFAVLGTAVCIASVAYFLLVAFYYLILVGILLGSIFLILIYYPEFMSLFSSANALNAFAAEFAVKYVPIIAPVTMAVAALSIAALAVSRQRSIGRIVLSAICLVTALVFTVLYSSMGGAK